MTSAAGVFFRRFTGCIGRKSRPFGPTCLRTTSIPLTNPDVFSNNNLRSLHSCTVRSSTTMAESATGSMNAAPDGEGDHLRLLENLRIAVKATNWQLLGKADVLSASRCTKFYSKQSGKDDLALFYHEAKFYALDATCPHEGGPLELGDVEDLNGDACVLCPWHEFDFSLTSGQSSVGLQTDVYDVEVVDGEVYVKNDTPFTVENPGKKKQGSAGSLAEAPAAIAAATSESENTLCHGAVRVLTTVDLAEKVRLSRQLYSDWQAGSVARLGKCQPPDQPPRQPDLVVKPRNKMSSRKTRNRAGVVGLLHSLCNIELWAIDLSWDIVARYRDFTVGDSNVSLPEEFYADWAKVADDEAKHFDLLNGRLQALGSHFGAKPVHNGLWEHATDTAEDLLGRLAIVHMVQEGRGLDMQPQLRSWLSGLDDESVAIMDVVIQDEITHVAAGIKWFRWVCHNSTPPLDDVSTFQELVRKYFFPGYLKPPFNKEARELAGFTEEWYLPLVRPS